MRHYLIFEHKLSRAYVVIKDVPDGQCYRIFLLSIKSLALQYVLYTSSLDNKRRDILNKLLKKHHIPELELEIENFLKKLCTSTSA